MTDERNVKNLIFNFLLLLFQNCYPECPISCRKNCIQITQSEITRLAKCAKASDVEIQIDGLMVKLLINLCILSAEGIHV